MDSLRNLELRSKVILFTAFILVCILVLLSWTKNIDTKTEEFIEDSLTKATVAFVVARTINAAVSVLQTGTFSVEAVGGVSLSVGQLLDPINDLVEDYSTVMKISIASLLIQRVLLEIFSSYSFSLILTVVFIAFLASFLLFSKTRQNWLFRIFLFILYLRFILVLVVIANQAVSFLFMDEKIGEELAIQQDFQGQLNANTSENLIPLEVRLQLDNEIASLEKQIQDKETAREREEERVSVKNIEIQNSAEAIDGFPFLVRMNPLHKNAALTQAQRKLEQQQQERESLLANIQQLENDLEVLREQVRQINLKLEGREDFSLWSLPQKINELGQNIISSVTSFTPPSKSDVEKIMKEFSESVLNLIALFILQCIFFPLMFFYLFSRATKYLFAVDLAVLLADRKLSADKA